MAKGILHYYISVKSVLKANWYRKMNNYILAEDLLITAKDHAFNAAEVCRGIKIADMKGDLEQHLFSFGQLALDLSHYLQDESKFKLPAPQQIFGLFRDLIFAL
jgi:hypothetical protein